MKAYVATLFLALATAMPAAAQDHPCAGAAIDQARKLLRFHLADPGLEQQIGDATKARRVGDVNVLKGKGKLDVLEVTADVYKASYRMRLLYARIPGSCTLMGQEIIEAGNPY